MTVTARVFATTHRGLVRTNNEDSLLVSFTRTGEVVPEEAACAVDLADGPLVLAVSDGMGGANAGEIASALTVDTLRDFFPREPGPPSLVAAIQEANAVVFAEASGSTERTGMGATVVGALVHADRAEIALVGDSRAYVLRRGRLSRLTRDQTYVQVLLDNGSLTPEQAVAFRHKTIILQSIGIAETTEPAVTELPLRRGDRLLLCSDGLTNEVAESEIEGILAGRDDPATAAASLVEAANARGGRDNVSVIVAFFDGAGLPEAAPGDVPPVPPPSGHFLAAR